MSGRLENMRLSCLRRHDRRSNVRSKQVERQKLSGKQADAGSHHPTIADWQEVELAVRIIVPAQPLAILEPFSRRDAQLAAQQDIEQEVQGNDVRLKNIASVRK
jgi:hypothetical protein